MYCESHLSTAKQFCQLLKREPDILWVKGHIHGVRRELTVATLLEIDGELAVFGPGRSWRVNVRREMGRIVAIPLRMSARPTKALNR